MFAGLRNVLLLLVCLLCATGHAWAVALGKIDVASHLGETFYAEVPIQLDANEKVSDVSVELASSTDYQILEVFRDAALNKLTVQLKNDKRGTRAVITSQVPMDTAYFNLVLKLRYGHATNFRKYPVFLDLPKQMQPPAVSAAPAPSVSAVNQQSAAPVVSAGTAPATTQQPGSKQPTKGFKPFSGWARIGRYGPMVRGDTISTVAQRLRVDNRFTLNQVMIALYDKNKSEFRANNINLIDAGSYLNVPTAAEVESVSDADASRILKEQNKRWAELKKQPVYAAVAEAQKNRYRTRVRIGESASGTPAAPVANAKTQAQAAAPKQAAQQQQAATPQQTAQESKTAAQLQELQNENQQLKQQLQASKATAGSAQQPETADAAAAQARAKKLQLSVIRLQQQILHVNQQLREMQTKSQSAQMLTYVLGGVIVLLIAVSGYLLFLLRRVRPHPAETSVASEPMAEEETTETGEYDIDSVLDSLGQLHDKMSAASQEPSPEQESIDTTASRGHRLEDVAAEEPAGIDYLAEAEVYLRYGMEDEALQQINRAIMEKPDFLDAHVKLIELLLSLGDASAVTAAIDSARGKLNEEDLPAFDDFVSSAMGRVQENVPDAGAEFEMTPADAELMYSDEEQEPTVAESTDIDVESELSETGSADAEPESTDVGSADADADLMEFLSSLNVQKEVAEGGAEPERDDAEQGAEEKTSEGLDFVPGGDKVVDAGSDEETMPWRQADDLTPPVSEDTGARDETDETGEAPSEGLEFILGKDKVVDTGPDEAGVSDSGEVGEEIMPWEQGDDHAGLTFELPDESLMEAEAPETKTDEHEGAALSFELPDEAMDLEGVEFATSGSEEKTYLKAVDEETLPEATLEAESTGDALGEILNEFDGLAENADVGGETGSEHPLADGSTDLSDVAALPETDVSNELGDILAEWDKDQDEIMVDAGPENLEVDRARSLLAEDRLDEAESSLQSAMNGDRKADALIGLAEVAAKRGDEARKAELLVEAEPLVDASNRDWFDSVKNLSD